MRRKNVLFLVLLDILALNFSYFLALFLRFERGIPSAFIDIDMRHVLVIIVLKIVVYYLFKLYASIWEYASIDELVRIVAAVVVANSIAAGYVLASELILSRGLLGITTMLDIVLIGGSRFLSRTFSSVRKGSRYNKNIKRVIIVGAGAAGVMTLKEVRNHKSLYSKPVGFIDDDPKKKGKIINGIPILGDRNDIYGICKKYRVDEIIIAIPSAKGDTIKEITNECKKTNCKTKILPGVYELLDGDVNVSKIRDVQIEDLLGREEIHLNLEELNSFIKGKKVLVTGGGGSIGSELCRQIATYAPSSLMILDIYENNAYELQQELLKKHKDLNLKVFIVSVRDPRRIDELIKEERPQIVFHAAAHKHVPLMENNPEAAIKNNVFGTMNVVQASNKYNVDKFVLISTDKAVNPTNVMGATKRMCEMIIQAYNSISNTDYVAVRFGNVLGSNGSVIPLFKRQIQEGGPVTITDERIVRYFMTIPEACQLVLRAGSMAAGGEIFVLDMGEPVKILDLAKDLIKLSGLKLGEDIEIKFTGLRPGEKLYEEILLDKDEMTQTRYEKIYIEEPIEFKYNDIMKYIKLLNRCVESNSKKMIRDCLKTIVPTYNPYVPEENVLKPEFDKEDNKYDDEAIGETVSS